MMLVLAMLYLPCSQLASGDHMRVGTLMKHLNELKISKDDVEKIPQHEIYRQSGVIGSKCILQTLCERFTLLTVSSQAFFEQNNVDNQCC
jgi:hypothetical protein